MPIEETLTWTENWLLGASAMCVGVILGELIWYLWLLPLFKRKGW